MFIDSCGEISKTSNGILCLLCLIQLCLTTNIPNCEQHLIETLCQREKWQSLFVLCHDGYCGNLKTVNIASVQVQYFTLGKQGNVADLTSFVHGLRREEAHNVMILGDAHVQVSIMMQVEELDFLLDQRAYLSHLSKWILLTNQFSHLQNIVTNVTLPVTNILAISPNTQDCSYQIYTSHWSNTERQFSFIGEYHHKHFHLHEDLFPNTKYGLNGRHILIGTNYWAPYTSKTVNNGSVHYYGLVVDMTYILADWLNFTFTFVEPPDMQWGVKDEKGNWNGIAGLLQRREVDLLMAPFVITHERILDMDFPILPYFVEPTIILYKVPDPDEETITLFLKPFHPLVWYLLLASIALCTVALYVLTKFSLGRNNRISAPQSFLECFWFTFGTLMSQGQPLSSTSNAARSIGGFWWLFVIALTSIYAAKLVSFLAVGKFSPPFSTMEDLADQDVYRFGTLGQTAYESAFSESNLTVNQKIWSKMQGSIGDGYNVLSTNHSYHLDLVQQGKYGYMIDLTTAQFVVSENCDYDISPARFLPMHYTIALQRHSAYTDRVTEFVNHMYSRGLLKQLFDTHWPDTSNLRCKKVSGQKTLGLFHLQGCFFIMGAGLGLALLIFAIELLICKIKRVK